MSLLETIIQHVQDLPKLEQAEVLNFVEYLQAKVKKQENKDWLNLSLSSAMRGLEDEQTPYSIEDLKESFS
ncbi:MAG: DUF2281 domain-containing protein [Deltaproteobacteria bacterium]|nr:DUF2281 domain-containing protein [Deltaproteobacteria bacterium]